MVESIRALGGYPKYLTPSNARHRLERRAQLASSIRHFFLERNVLEVDTPLLSRYPVSDPLLDSLSVADPFSSGNHYLQTSPEYAMKSLLSMGSGSIFQLCKAFRADQIGRLHDMEFTMLEWYRVEFTLDQLLEEIAALLAYVGGPMTVQHVYYRQLFIDCLSIDPFCASLDELKRCADRYIDVNFDDHRRNTWLDLLLTHCIEPQLGVNDGKPVATFLHDYPADQAALAAVGLDDQGNSVAMRAELYVNGIELANAYQELTDLAELECRVTQDNSARRAMQQPEVELDPLLKEALERGLPFCSGVALGVDRLLFVNENMP